MAVAARVGRLPGGRPRRQPHHLPIFVPHYVHQLALPPALQPPLRVLVQPAGATRARISHRGDWLTAACLWDAVHTAAEHTSHSCVTVHSLCVTSTLRNHAGCQTTELGTQLGGSWLRESYHYLHLDNTRPEVKNSPWARLIRRHRCQVEGRHINHQESRSKPESSPWPRLIGGQRRQVDGGLQIHIARALLTNRISERSGIAVWEC